MRKPTELRMRVPGKDYAADPDMLVLWRKTGTLIEVATGRMPDRALMFSVILSRITRELRREYGTEGARAMLQAYVDTMAQAARGDRDSGES